MGHPVHTLAQTWFEAEDVWPAVVAGDIEVEFAALNLVHIKIREEEVRLCHRPRKHLTAWGDDEATAIDLSTDPL